MNLSIKEPSPSATFAASQSDKYQLLKGWGSKHILGWTFSRSEKRRNLHKNTRLACGSAHRKGLMGLRLQKKNYSCPRKLVTRPPIRPGQKKKQTSKQANRQEAFLIRIPLWTPQRVGNYKVRTGKSCTAKRKWRKKKIKKGGKRYKAINFSKWY